MGKQNTKCYAVYKGDTFLDLGTLEELEISLHMNRKNLHWYKSPTAMKRLEKNPGSLIAILIPDDDMEVQQA